MGENKRLDEEQGCRREEEDVKEEVERLIPPEATPISADKAKWQLVRALRTLKKQKRPVRCHGYRVLCKRYHPDKQQDESMRGIMQEAFQFLQKFKPGLMLDGPWMI